jgi:hypothetical protein
MTRHLDDLSPAENSVFLDNLVSYQKQTIAHLQKAYGLCEGCILRVMIQSAHIRYDALREAVAESGENPLN